MILLTQIFAGLILSFLLGSIPTAYIIVRFRKQKDIRLEGSGNVGTMNVWKLLGWKAALIVFLFDGAKGAGTVYLCLALGINPNIGLAVSVACHIFTPWLKFKGGKGLATALGGILLLGQWQVILTFALVWLLFFLLIHKKNMDIANFYGALGVAIYGLIVGTNWGLVIMAVLVLFKHLKVIKC